MIDITNHVVLQDVDANDLDLYNRFMPTNDELAVQPVHGGNDQADKGANLADLILEKIAAHEAATARAPNGAADDPPGDAIELPAKVVEVYSK